MTGIKSMPAAYRRLASDRVATKPDGFFQPESFGYDFSGWVSPYTKGAHRRGGFVIVLQDWASVDGLPFADPEIQEWGRLGTLKTNRTLDYLLKTVLGRRVHDVYVTNAFPFVKPGRMSAALPRQTVDGYASRFLHRELELAEPACILALGAVAQRCVEDANVACTWHALPHPAARIGRDAQVSRWIEALGTRR